MNAVTINGLTPLHYAAKQGNEIVLSMLLDASASVSAQDTVGGRGEFWIQ